MANSRMSKLAIGDEAERRRDSRHSDSQHDRDGSDSGEDDSFSSSSDRDEQCTNQSARGADGSGSGTDESGSNSDGMIDGEEPFESFEPKVMALMRDLGLRGIIEITNIKAGETNRLVRIKSRDKATESMDAVLRMFRLAHGDTEAHDPTETNAKIQEHAAILNSLQSFGLAVPAVLAYDSTYANAPRRPYVLQEAADGVSLNTVYDDLPLEAKLSIADALVDFKMSLETITFGRCGRLTLKATEEGRKTSGAPRYTAWNAPEPLRTSVEVSGFQFSGYEPLFESRAKTNLRGFLTEQFKCHVRRDEQFYGANLMEQEWDKLRTMQAEMDDAGFFSGGVDPSYAGARNILHHWDLEPRNIMVRRKMDKSKDAVKWEITKVIDWDDCRSMPAVLTRKPPMWLWDWSELEDHPSIPSLYGFDDDVLPADRYDPKYGRLDEDGRRIRERYESRLVRKLSALYPGYDRAAYHDDAYGRGRWVRLLARFSIEGLGHSEDFRRLEYLHEEWVATRAQFM